MLAEFSHFLGKLLAGRPDRWHRQNEFNSEWIFPLDLRDVGDVRRFRVEPEKYFLPMNFRRIARLGK